MGLRPWLLKAAASQLLGAPPENLEVPQDILGKIPIENIHAMCDAIRNFKV